MRTTAVLFSFLIACGPSDGSPGGGGGGADGGGDPRPDGGTGGFVDASTPVDQPDPPPSSGCDKMDILFVVDNSGSMGQEQENLAANFPKFIQVLEDYGDLDYHVGVTSTGMDYNWSISTPLGNLPSDQKGGDNGNGRLVQNAGCGMTKRWLNPSDPDPSGTFACAAQLGTNGPAQEMPLKAVKAAFGDRMQDGTNVGFRRDDALLAIVILTDEDDCSYEQSVTLGFAESLCSSKMEPVDSYLAFLDGYTGDRKRWATAVIAGPDNCSSEFGNADHAKRLQEFVSKTGPNGVFSSICAGDLAVGLADALATFDLACDSFPPVD